MTGMEQNTGSTDLDALLKEALSQDVPGGQQIRQRLLAEIRPPLPEILTLSEAAALLRLSEPELAEIADSLPAFELAGRILLRKSRLLEWVAQREQQYAWSAAHSRESHVRHPSIRKGVA